MQSRKVLLQVLLHTAAVPAVLMLGTLAFAQTSGTQMPGGSTAQPSQSSGQGAGTGGGSFSQPGTASTINDAGHMAQFESRLASIKSALQLTSEQERLWPAAESAMREAVRKHHEERERMRNASAPSDFVERMRRRADMMTSRGEAMKRVADAVQPLHDSLTADQKRRVASLMREHMAAGGGEQGNRGGRAMRQHERGGMGQGMGQGQGRYGWDRDRDRRGYDRDSDQYGGGRHSYRGYQGWQRGNEDDFNLYDPNWRSRSYDYERSSPGDNWRGYGPRGDNRGWRRGHDDDSPRGYGNRDQSRYGRYGDEDDRRGYGNRGRNYDNHGGTGNQYDGDTTDDDHHDDED